jgi:hypothetical protein
MRFFKVVESHDPKYTFMTWRYVGQPSGNNGLGGMAEVLAVHAALLPIGPIGMILYFGGSSWLPDPHWENIDDEAFPNLDPGYSKAKSEIDNTRLFDCLGHVVVHTCTPDADLFCSGHAMLPDGRLLVCGGTQHHPFLTAGMPNETQESWHHAHWSGSRQTWIFDTFRLANPWKRGSMLNRNPSSGTGGGRWYPTLVTLATGEIMANTGHPQIEIDLSTMQNRNNNDARHNNTTPEIFDGSSNQWQIISKALGVDGAHDYSIYYPRMHTVPHTGEVFIVQPLYSTKVIPPDPNNQYCQGEDPETGLNLCTANPADLMPPYNLDVKDKSLFYDCAAKQVTRAFPGPIDQMYTSRFYTSQPTSSVMLPLLHEENYHPRVMICGASIPMIADLMPAVGEPEWSQTANRVLQGSVPRNFVNATLLPTGEVVVSGGVAQFSGINSDGSNYYTPNDGVRVVEIYRPAANGQPDSWIVGPAANETRGYHSVALLMPDGRVWTAGSEIESKDKAISNFSIELFEPDYVPKERIKITVFPNAVSYGQSFVVHFFRSNNQVQVSRVVFMRPGSVTHSFDGDQRYISVPFNQKESMVECTAPPNSTIAPPGYYMLWLIDQNNIPCKQAQFIWLGKYGVFNFPGQNASKTGHITSISRIENSMEVFWIANDGSIQDANGYEGVGWKFGQLPLPAHGSVNGGIVALARIPNSLEIFWVGIDGSIQDGNWYEGPNSKWETFSLTGPGTAAKDTMIAAVSRIKNSMEIFWINDYGILYHAAWYQGYNWANSPLMPQQQVKAAKPGRVAVVSRIPETMELFWIAVDGAVHGAFWYEGQSEWKTYQLADAGDASIYGDICAVSRNPNNIEVFWITPNSSIRNASWNALGPGFTPPWKFQFLSNLYVQSKTGCIKAVCRTQQNLDVFWIGDDGIVRHAAWENGGTWQYDNGTGSGSMNAISVVSRIPKSIELFYIRDDGSICDNFIYY